jgi:hypothetical protein
VQEILGDRLAGVGEEGFGIGAEIVLDVFDHDATSSKPMSLTVQKKQPPSGSDGALSWPVW